MGKMTNPALFVLGFDCYLKYITPNMLINSGYEIQLNDTCLKEIVEKFIWKETVSLAKLLLGLGFVSFLWLQLVCVKHLEYTCDMKMCYNALKYLLLSTVFFSLAFYRNENFSVLEDFFVLFTMFSANCLMFLIEKKIVCSILETYFPSNIVLEIAA